VTIALREILLVRKQATLKCDVNRLSLKNLSEVEFKGTVPDKTLKQVCRFREVT
jgi:hypothetical protein